MVACYGASAEGSSAPLCLSLVEIYTHIQGEGRGEGWAGARLCPGSRRKHGGPRSHELSTRRDRRNAWARRLGISLFPWRRAMAGGAAEEANACSSYLSASRPRVRPRALSSA